MNRTLDVNNSAHILLDALKSRKKRGSSTLETDIPYFSMEDVRQVLLARENEQREQENRIKIQNKQKLIEKVLHENKNTVVAAAGIADILGFDPIRKTSTLTLIRAQVAAKYEEYYSKLLQFKEAREHIWGVLPA
jgi:hypothetical protein